jgi:hypothetical protein
VGVEGHISLGPLKVPSDAVSEKSKNASIFTIRKVLPNFLSAWQFRPPTWAIFNPKAILVVYGV